MANLHGNSKFKMVAIVNKVYLDSTKEYFRISISIIVDCHSRFVTDIIFLICTGFYTVHGTAQ